MTLLIVMYIFWNWLTKCFGLIQKLIINVPNGGQYLQILSGKDLYKQTIVISVRENDTVSSDDTFPASFLNIFVNYPLGTMRICNKSWTNWNKAPLKLWQTQLNFAVWGQSEHLNYEKHSRVRALYRFHVYYHVRRILKRSQER